MKYIYLIKRELDNNYKIGIAKNPNKRIKQLQTGSDSKLFIVDQYLVKNAKNTYLIETALHNFYTYAKISGEWFKLNLEDELDFQLMCEKIENNLESLKNINII